MAYESTQGAILCRIHNKEIIIMKSVCARSFAKIFLLVARKNSNTKTTLLPCKAVHDNLQGIYNSLTLAVKLNLNKPF